MKKALISQTPKAAIGIKVDKAKLRAAADRYLNASAVYAALLAVSRFKFNDLPTFWRNVVSLVNAVISAVELAKSEFEGVPGQMAASVAVDILDDAITFTGPVGSLVEIVDAPFLKLLVNMVLGDRHGIIWTKEARSMLGLKPVK